MLRYSQHILIPVFEKLFNMILRTGKYPSSWCDGFIVPIFKNGDPLLLSNYRGITILSAVSKVFNTILHSRIDKFIKEHNLVDHNQIGFQKGSRTSDHMFVLKTLIDKYTAKNGRLYACFVDFKKGI